MTLPASGAISLSDVNVEMGYAGNTLINFSDAVVRALFDKSLTGAISLNDGHGKAAFGSNVAPVYYWYDNPSNGYTTIYWNNVKVYDNTRISSPYKIGDYTYYALPKRLEIFIAAFKIVRGNW